MEFPLAGSTSAMEWKCSECPWESFTSVSAMTTPSAGNDGRNSAVLSDESPRSSKAPVATWPSLVYSWKGSVEEGIGCGKGEISECCILAVGLFSTVSSFVFMDTVRVFVVSTKWQSVLFIYIVSKYRRHMFLDSVCSTFSFLLNNWYTRRFRMPDSSLSLCIYKYRFETLRLTICKYGKPFS
jgi:hypothetical protein